MEEISLSSNGLAFHALAAGPPDGPLVLLLHGFPELALSWTDTLAALGAAGHRAVAPDLRGYGGSDKRGPYDTRTLAADAAGLVRALGREKAAIVGHDWGGAVAWATAAYHPEVVERLGIVDCPHPAALRRELWRNPRQLRRSWYMLAFQIPWLPERILTRDGATAIGRALRGGSSVRARWTRERTRPYQESFSQEGAASAALGYYRAALRSARPLRRAALAHPIAVPTLIVWGAEDRFVGVELTAARHLDPWFSVGNRARVEILDGVGHFVPVEAPERLNPLLLDWLRS